MFMNVGYPILGLSQPQGLLTVVSTTACVLEAIGTNVDALMGRDAASLCGRPLAELLMDDDPGQGLLQGLQLRADRPHRVHLKGSAGQPVAYDATVQRAVGGRSIIEFVVAGVPLSTPTFELATKPIQRMAEAPHVEALLTQAARDLRAISGFARVVVRKFEPDGRATVVAEAGPADAPMLETPFRPVARSPIVTVADTLAAPVPIIGVSTYDRTSGPDLARAALWFPTELVHETNRSRMPRALLRLTIIARGRAWGEILGLHHEALELDYRVRSLCELLGQLLGWALNTQLEAAKVRERALSTQRQARIARALERPGTISSAVLDIAGEILKLFAADSFVLRLSGKSTRTLNAPADDTWVTAVAARLDARADNGIAFTNRPADLGGGETANDGPASGALYLRLMTGGSAFLLFLRARDARPWTSNDSKAALALRDRLHAQLRLRTTEHCEPQTVDLSTDARIAQTRALLRLHDAVAAALPSRAAITQVILAFVARETRADAATLEALDDVEIVCEAATGSLTNRTGSRVARAGTLAGICADLDTPLICDDAAHDLEPAERDDCLHAGVASMVVVPIAISDNRTVVLKVASARRAAFGDDDIQTLRLAATNLSTALRAAREFAALAVAEREQRLYAQQLRALHTIATTTTSKARDQIDAALRIGLEQLGLDWAFLGRNDGLTAEIVLENSVSRHDEARAPRGARYAQHSLIGSLANISAVNIIDDTSLVAHDPQSIGLSTMIAAPLVIDGINYGVIGFTSRLPRGVRFSSADSEFVAMTAELVASAIERGLQREQLVTSETRYRALTEAIPEMVWVVDAQNTFEYVNARWTAYTGLTLEACRRTADASIFDDDGLRTIAFERSAVERTEFECEVRIRRHDGAYRWHLVRSVPFHGSAGEWLVTATDIADRKAAETLMTGVHEAALAATEAKSRFLATMSHEIRTPMNAVIGMTELLLLTQLSEEQREYLEIVRNSGQSLLRVLNDILDYSKIEAGKLELEMVHFDLPSQIESVVELLRAQYQMKGVRLTTQTARNVPTLVVGDPGRLRQILLNLVGNALKFTPQHGHVHIEVLTVGDVDEVMPIRFSVEDTGIGIAPEVVERLFQPFSQGDESTTRKYGGTGLGLSICAQLVALMNGTIGVDSVLGAGSTFYFTIPLRSAKQPSKTQDARKRGTIARTKPVVMRAEKILLVEDNEINTFLALKQLQRIGFIVSAVNNGRQAIDAVSRERFDLVFMDCHMPEMDGFAATREIRRLEAQAGGLRRLPIVAITADARTEDHQNCLRAGMDDYISKPTSLESLRAVLDRWLPSPDRRQSNRNGTSRSSPPPTLRVAKLLEIFGGDRGAVITLLTAAVGAIKADFARIENCVAGQEQLAVAEAARRLKGTSASIRSTRLGEISVAIERAALAGQVSPELVAELRNAVDTLIADVEKHGKLLATIG